MGKLINADSLKKEFSGYRDSLYSCYYTPIAESVVDDLIDYVDDAPAVDAVEVVRCKDCKHCGKHTYVGGQKYYGCDYISPYEFPEVDLNHYCGYGESREENEVCSKNHANA